MCECVRARVPVYVSMSASGASGPVNATTLADGSNNGIGEKEKARDWREEAMAGGGREQEIYR